MTGTAAIIFGTAALLLTGAFIFACLVAGTVKIIAFYHARRFKSQDQDDISFERYVELRNIEALERDLFDAA